MQHPDDIHRYLTETVVGSPVAVVMGPSETLEQQPVRRPFLVWLDRRFTLAGVAVHSLWAEPAEAAAGRPLALDGLRRWRSRVALGFLSLWTLAVAGGTAWWLRS